MQKRSTTKEGKKVDPNIQKLQCSIFIPQRVTKRPKPLCEMAQV